MLPRREERTLLSWSAPRGVCRGSLFVLILLFAIADLGGGRQAQAQVVSVPARLPPLPVASLNAPPGMSHPVGPDSMDVPTALQILQPLPSPWEVDAIGKLSASQAAYRNWTEGGLNTLAFTTSLKGEAIHTTDSWKQSYTTDLAIGFVQQDTLTIRKASDRLHLTSTLQYRGDGFFRTFNPTVAMSLRTQFLTGFNYDQNPFGDDREPPVEVSDFLSPATFTQSLGLTYEPKPWIAQRLSLGAKEVLVVDKNLRVLYDLPSGDGLRYEAGLESTTELDRRFFEDVHVQSSLQLFAAFNREEVPDMRWENLISLEFNKWLSLDFELAALYDSDVTQALQVREVVSLGASVEML